jgi:hypothetical protein
MMHEGRVKPLDSVARNTLQLLSNRTSLVMPDDAPAGSPQGSISATQWLLAHMAAADWADHAPVFRIDAMEVLDLFDLTRRKGHRYSAKELAAGRRCGSRSRRPATCLPSSGRSSRRSMERSTRN